METMCILRVCADRASAMDVLARKDILSLLNLPRNPKDQPVATDIAAVNTTTASNLYKRTSKRYKNLVKCIQLTKIRKREWFMTRVMQIS